MAKKVPRRSPLASVPAPHTPGAPPKRGRVPSSPQIDPVRNAPPIQSTPRQRPVAKVPSPRRPTIVRGKDSGLRDLFEFFPDLPRPPRPAARSPKRRRLRR